MMQDSHSHREYRRVKQQATTLRENYEGLLTEHRQLLQAWNAVPENQRHLSRYRKLGERLQQCGADVTHAQRLCVDAGLRMAQAERNLRSSIVCDVTARINAEVEKEMAAI